MRRRLNHEFGDSPRVAVISHQALGNYVVATPLLQMMRRRWPAAELVHVIGSRMAELAEAAPFCSWSTPEDVQGPFDWVVNLESADWAGALARDLAGDSGLVDGPCLAADGSWLPHADTDCGRLAADPDWTGADLQARHPLLTTPFIGEIFCRVAGLEGDVPACWAPDSAPRHEADLILSTSATLPEKLWPEESWLAVATAATDKGWSLAVVGAKPSDQATLWQGGSAEERLIREAGARDLRGQFSLVELTGVLRGAKAVACLDNGIMHLASAAKADCCALFRHGIHRLWTQPVPWIKVMEPGPDRDVAQIAPESMISALGLNSDDPE